jgi:ABC-type glycerol-3-phosphate transport system permease component
MRPVEVGLSVFLQEEQSEFHLLMAASTVVMLPILIVFLPGPAPLHRRRLGRGQGVGTWAFRRSGVRALRRSAFG